MVKRAQRRSDRLAVRTPATILFLSARSEDALSLLLRKSFDGAQFLPDPTLTDIRTADLAVGIFEAGDDHRRQAFAASTRQRGVPSLGVELREDEAIIGPLALPGEPGCGQCAFERMAAASGVEPRIGVGPVSADVLKLAGSWLVREIRKIVRRGAKRSQLVDHVLAVDARTGDASLHRVIPLSRCKICGGAAAFPRTALKPRRLSPEASPEFVLGALAGWVDQRTGVISGVFLEPPCETVPGLPIIAMAAPPNVLNDDGTLRRLPLGWGKGLTISGAVLSAVGEAIERYSASLPDSGRIRWARPEDLDREYLDPRDFALYTEAQYERDGFPYARFDPSIAHPWVLGEWLASGAQVWVPAVFAFLSFSLWPEHLICQGSSNGLAAATDVEEAALRATLELVERDAFMAAWLARCPGRRVQLDETLDPSLHRVLDGLEALGATIEVYILPTSACGTTALCLGLGDGKRYPGATLGLGTDLDSRAALRQAVLELGQTGPYLQRMMCSDALRVPEDPGCVLEMLDHAAYYFPRNRSSAFDGIRNHDPLHALSDLAEGASKRSLANCRSALDVAGIRVALVDVTSADVARGPFRVVRAVSPDLQPLSYGFGLEREAVARIRRMKPASEVPAIHPIW